MPPLPSHQVTIHDGLKGPAVAIAVVDRSANLTLNVRLVPSSLAEASRMSIAPKFGPAVGTTGKSASPAASVLQLPGGMPCVPETETVPWLAEAEVIATLGKVPC